MNTQTDNAADGLQQVTVRKFELVDLKDTIDYADNLCLAVQIIADSEITPAIGQRAIAAVNGTIRAQLESLAQQIHDLERVQ